MALDPAYISVRIRELLQATGHGLTIPAIAEHLGEDAQRIRESVNTMVSRTGGGNRHGALRAVSCVYVRRCGDGA